MKKPTGESGITKITETADGAKVEFMPAIFPATKEAIEAEIAVVFLKLAPQMHVFPCAGCEPQKNPEADLDFTLRCPDGTARKLELMEIAPLEHAKTFNAASPSYKPYELTQYILAKIHGKSKKYGPARGAEKHLLIYNTDWKFILSESVIALLQYWTLHTSHNFSGIYLYMPMSKVEGVSKLLFPTPLEFWKTFNPDSLRDNVVHNLSPKGWK
jgi:hypothetical protein